MRSFTAVVVLALLAAACGARTDLPEGNGEDFDASLPEDAHTQDVSAKDTGPQDAAFDAKPDVQDAAIQDAGVDADDAAIDGGPPPECIPDCTHNYQCELTCPPLQTGRWCCDEQVGVCYAFAGHHCPNPIFDAGFD